MKTAIPVCANWKLGGFDCEGLDIRRLLNDEAEPALEWMDVNACEDVHSALIRHGRIRDPAVGVNDEACYWVESMIWVYRTTVAIPAGHPWLVFEGLDTFAEVYLNGRLVERCENMLVQHAMDAGGFARAGENSLVVCFYPVHEACLDKPLPQGFWTNYSTDRAYARKAGYSFGWDWTPRVLTAGIWRPVQVIAEENGVLSGLKCAVIALEAERARIRLAAQCLHEPTGNWAFRYTIRDAQNAEVAKKICSEGETEAEIAHPHLWWTHDLGEPYLYTVECELIADGCVQDRLTRKLGVRTVDMVTQSESGEARFVICLNGKTLFARGANWVPMSNRPSSVPDAACVRLVGLAKEAGMNLLSVWGGGIYERDAFYDACDQMGILVWQYFMFACGEYPDFDAQFVEQVRQEVEKAIWRLASHPCIAMWIGNVESEMLCQKVRLQRPMYGRALFEEKMPEWLARLDPERYYLPSSPWGEELMNGEDGYDRHNWDVWFRDLPYTAYAQDETTFASEFGIQAAPALSTIRKYCGSDVWLGDFSFRYLSRDQDPEHMWHYLRTYAGEPKTLEDYVDLTMLVQADALAFACEHFRRRFPRCGGALIWQHNDCCPVQSWSLIDVDLIPKAAYYAVKRSFAPIAISIKRVDEHTSEIWCANDTLKEQPVTVEARAGSFLGHIAYSERLSILMQPGERKCLKRVTVGGRFYPNVIIGNRPRLYYLSACLEGEERPQVRFFAEHKDLAMPQAHLKAWMNGGSVVISTDTFADMVKLDGELEGLDVTDNYFHMLPQTQRTIGIRALWGKGLEERRLVVKALNSCAYELKMR